MRQPSAPAQSQADSSVQRLPPQPEVRGKVEAGWRGPSQPRPAQMWRSSPASYRRGDRDLRIWVTGTENWAGSSE